MAKLWTDNKTSEQVEDWHDKEQAVFNLQEDVQCLREEAEKYRLALENIKKHHEISLPRTMLAHSTTWQLVTRALEE